MNRPRATIAALIASIFAIVLVGVILTVTQSIGDQSPIAGDPVFYHEIADDLLNGGAPYVDVPVEHLPAALLPMVAVEWVVDITGVGYGFMWSITMAAVFIATVFLWGGANTAFDAGSRFLLLSLPLLPLLLFRVEPWILLLATVSILAAASSQWALSATTAVIATVGKGWPIVLLALPWRNGRASLAYISTAVSLGLLAVVALLPGFREGRAFEGIHSETMVGSVLLTFRHVLGLDSGIIGTAGATYTEAFPGAVVLNALIAIPILVVAVYAIHKGTGVWALMPPVGLSVAAVILLSPLFSSQFIFWLVPFAMFLPLRHRWMFISVGTVTLATVVWWYPESWVWSAMVLVRNGLFLALVAMWAIEVMSATRQASSAGVSEKVA